MLLEASTPVLMELEFSGAAREATGSCHILRVAGRTILLDCGLFQGRRKESDAKNRRLPLPVDEIDAVVLSHALVPASCRIASRWSGIPTTISAPIT